LALEFEILQHLSAAHVPVAVPLLGRRGSPAVVSGGHLFSLSPFLKTRGSAEAIPWEVLCIKYGAAIGDLHIALASFPPERLVGRTWRNDPMKDSFENRIPSLQQFLQGDQAIWFKRIIAEMESEMKHALADLPEQLIHRDCHPGNVLTDGAEVIGFIDCDHLSLGPPVLDLAYFVIHLVKGDVHDPDKAAGWLHYFPLVIQGYEQKIRLSDHEKAALPYMIVYVLVLFADFFYHLKNEVAAKVELDALVFIHSHLEEIRQRTLEGR
jgi:Ser/Thr protein kinase RdoA (MazF antagonist)